jgi:tetratricopeptide (TPR) repeat protein
MSDIADSPYPGPRAFRQADQDRFFGREKDAEAIATLWREHRLTVVSGPVASGKTSLLQAGVYPLLRKSRWDAIFAPGRLSYGTTYPFAALPAYNSYTLALLRSWSPGEAVTWLAGQSVGEFVRRQAQRQDGIVFAAIDQAEELFVDTGSGIRTSWRRQFLDELVQAVSDEPRLHLLLVTRSEAVDLISVAVGHGASYMVVPLTRASAIEAVAGPAAAVGRPFADGAAEKLVTDLQASRAPDRDVTEDLVQPALLQIVCARLWRNLPHAAAGITARDVRAVGDADTTLAAYWSDTIAAVAAEHDLAANRLHSWLTSTFITQVGISDTVYLDTVNAGGLSNAVARSLVNRHLLATELIEGQRWYALLTDRLIDPLLKATDEHPPPVTADDYLRMAERALGLGELDLVQHHAGQALQAAPTTRVQAEAQSLLGNLAYELARSSDTEAHYQAAEAHYRTGSGLFEAAGDSAAAVRQLAAVGQMLLAQGRAAEAVDELRAAVNRVPNDLILQTELALATWQFGDGRTAVAILTSVLGIDGGYTEALRARGEILADLGEASHAMLDLDRQAVRDRPSTLAAHGLALAELGNHPAANREINDAVDKAPRNGPVLLYAARASALGGDTVSSGELARRAVDATDPPLSPPQRKLAERLAAPG